MNDQFEREQPSAAYRAALRVEMEAHVEPPEVVVGPALVQAGLPIDLEPMPELVECESDDEDDDVEPEVPFAEKMEEEAPLDRAAVDEEDGVGAEAVEPEHPLVDNLRQDEVRMVRSGDKHRIGMLWKGGRPVQFVAAMKKGATKATIQKALKQKGARGDLARAAAIAEIKQIDDKGSWKPVRKADLPRQVAKGIVRSFMFVIDKHSPEGTLIKVKARLVAMGNMQDPDGISMDSSAPTVNITSVMIMSALSARWKRHNMSCDVGGAFLHTIWPKVKGRQAVHLDRICTIFLLELRPEYREYVQPDGTLIMELDRALYGLIQSAKLWYDRLCDVLKGAGYVMNPVDPCVWNKGVGDEQSTVLFHVDDLSCSCKNLETLKDLETLLISEFGEEHIKCQWGDVHEYLGMLFKYNGDGTVTISMPGYTSQVLETAGFDATKTARTPANGHLFMERDDSPPLTAERAKLFHSVVQALSYMCQRVRYDIMTAVAYLKTRVSNPTEFDESKLARCLYYLNGTRDLGLTLGVRGESIEVDSSIDASHAVYPNGRSQGGLGISLGVGLVKGRSHKLDINTKSSCESELVEVSDDVSEVIWTRDFLLGQGYDVGPATVRQDNQATIRLLEKGRSDSKRTKHINTRFFFVHDRIEKGEIRLEYTPTTEMVADFFTKPLQGALFLKMRDKLLGITAFSD
jgi:hypothetical protein